MLSRAIARSTRLPALQRSVARPSVTPRVPIAASTLWARGMANDKRPPKPSRSNAPGQDAPGQDVPGQAGAPNSKGSVPAPEPPKSPESTGSPSESTDAPAPKPDMSSLPDLTQGIPSTLEYETSGATKKSELQALQEAEDAESQGGGGRSKGELPASAYMSSTEKKRAQLANRMYIAALVTAIAGMAYLGREWDEEEAPAHTDIPQGWTPALWWKRAVARLTDVTEYYREPAFDKLLPDPDPMFERPYTLCISLEDMLVHSEWTREHGWRVAKRPGVDYFLHYISQYYELVLFTSVPFAMGEPLMRKLDPYHFIVWPLYREATKYKDGEIVKDLSYLNRDLSKVIILDTKPEHVQNQPENAIILPKWTGDPKDKELVSLIPFLEYVHTMQYKDVRQILSSFNGKHIPTEFARREALARAEFNKQVEAQKPKRKSGMQALGNMLGLKPGNMSMMLPPEGEQSTSEAFAQGKMLQDVARERGRRNYEMMEREIRENGEKWLKEEQMAQEKAQAEAMNSVKSSFVGWFSSSNQNQSSESANAEGKK
ncbi:HAD-like domain-containing protein [Xylariomycetidae sp. FL0641]|nr:HAD-like domain-containing protein [Xylariomycetidae sp. FL0641]